MLSLILVVIGITLLAAAVQAVTGFGYALVSMPLLTLAADPRTAVVVNAIAGLGMTLTVAVRERAHARWRAAGLLVVAALAGMPAGLLVLRIAPETVLTALIGVGVVGCAVLIWRGLRLPPSRAVFAGTGVLAGALSTSTGTNGPPLVAAFQAMGYEPRAFRATLAVIFSGSGVLSLLGFAVTGQLTPEAAQLGLLGAPAAVLGWGAGNLLFHRIPADRFRRLVLGALIVSGGLLVAAPAVGG